MVLGEYESDSGYFLPNPAFCNREYLRLRFEVEWSQSRSKINILGALLYVITITNKIQSREYSRNGGLEEVMHITDSDGNPNVFELKRNDNGKRWFNANWTNPDDKWNLDNEVVFRLRKHAYFSFAKAREFCFIF